MHHQTWLSALRTLFAALLLPVLVLASCGGKTDGEGPAYELTYTPSEGTAQTFEADSAEELTALVSAWTAGGNEPVLKDFTCMETDGLLYRSAEASFSGQS
ncbi:MAG: hypothetical protein J5843_02910, partial [Clostridia bacterium]|nr:hypothetical protein [Clostridia bacterium]